MKHIAGLFILLILSTVTVYSQSPIYFNDDEILKDLAFFESCYPRMEGSEQERKALTYIESTLSSLKIPYEITDFSEMEGVHSFSRSLYVTLPGVSPDTILLVMPIGHPEEAAKDEAGAINLALALGFIKACAFARELPVTVKVLLLGGEFQQTGAQGTALFLRSYFPETSAAALYVNFKKLPSRLLFTTGGKEGIAPYWLIRTLFGAVSETRIPFAILGNQNQIFRLRMTEKGTSVDPYLAAGIPGVGLEGETLKFSTAPGSAVEIGGFFYSFYLFLFRLMDASAGVFSSSRDVERSPLVWDRHYLFFQLRDRPIVIPEQTLILLFIAILTIPLVYIVLAKKRFLKYLSNFLKFSYVVPLFYLLIFFFLFLGTEALRFTSGLRHMPELWKYAPGLLFSLKIAFALALFFPAFRIIRRIRFPRNRNFYSMTAIFFLLGSAIFVSLYNISLAYYFVWAFFWAVLFSLFANRFLKLACFLVSPIWLFKIGNDIFTLPAFRLLEYAISSRFVGNLILAAVILPYIIMIMRLGFAFSHPREKVRKAFAGVVYGLIGGTTGVLLYLVFRFVPFSDALPQPLSYRDVINLDAMERTVVLQSPAPLKGLSVRSPDFQYSIGETLREVSFTPESLPSFLDIRIQNEKFLDRIQYTVTLKAEGIPARFLLSLQSRDTMILYDCNFPFTLDPQGKAAVIHTGDHPPVPLDLEFTIPGNLNADITIALLYSSLPYDLGLSGISMKTDTRLRIIKTYALPR